MKRQLRLKTAYKWILLTVLIPVVLHMGVTATLKWAVNDRIRALRSAGEPIYPADMIGPAVPDDQNGAVELSQVIKVLESKTLPANLSEFLQRPHVADHDEKWWKQTERELCTIQRIFPLIKAGMAKPRIAFADDHIIRNLGDFYEYDLKIRKVVRVLRLRAICDARNGQMHHVADTIFDMLTFSPRFLTKHSPNGNFRNGLFINAARLLATDALKDGMFSREDSERLDDALASVDLSKRNVCYLREERIRYVAGISSLYMGKGLDSDETPSRVIGLLLEPFVRYLELYFLDYTQKAIEECGGSGRRDRKKLLALGRHYSTGAFGIRILDEVYFKILDHNQSYFSLTRIVIRIKSFKRENGTYPVSLSQIGTSLPQNPVTGKPYSYIKIGRGFAIYYKGPGTWTHPLIKNPTIEQKLKKNVVIGWIYKT